MLRLRKEKKGFTLIELMIVVAIIGILAAIAIPKFADLIRKSKEASTKGSLGAMRAAIVIYYGDNEGLLPPEYTNLIEVMHGNTHKYLDEVPWVKLGITGIIDSNTVDASVTTATFGTANNWGYRSLDGKVVVASGLTDTRGGMISAW